jgi:hypothetical protein
MQDDIFLLLKKYKLLPLLERYLGERQTTGRPAFSNFLFTNSKDLKNHNTDTQKTRFVMQFDIPLNSYLLLGLILVHPAIIFKFSCAQAETKEGYLQTIQLKIRCISAMHLYASLK